MLHGLIHRAEQNYNRNFTTSRSSFPEISVHVSPALPGQDAFVLISGGLDSAPLIGLIRNYDSGIRLHESVLPLRKSAFIIKRSGCFCFCPHQGRNGCQKLAEAYRSKVNFKKACIANISRQIKEM